jgi:hypothetical protein
MTRFQLVFRRNGEGDQLETRDNNHVAEPHIDGKLIVDGETYVIRGVEWIVRADGDHRDATGSASSARSRSSLSRTPFELADGRLRG